MQTKEYILEKASELFARFGISSVTMDIVARECGISKRTLYENFADKKSLLITVVENAHEEQSRQMAEICKNSPNQIVCFLNMYSVIKETLSKVSPAFFIDMERLYPYVSDTFNKKRKCMVSDMAEMIDKGIEEGMFRSELNSMTTANLYFRIIHKMKWNDGIDYTQSEMFDTFYTFFIIFLRGISSEKGLREFENYMNNNKK